jgi:hypothetical protein
MYSTLLPAFLFGCVVYASATPFMNFFCFRFKPLAHIPFNYAYSSGLHQYGTAPYLTDFILVCSGGAAKPREAAVT